MNDPGLVRVVVGSLRRAVMSAARRQDLVFRLKQAIERADRYRYYLGVAAWDRGDYARTAALESTVVGSPEELWARARSLVDDPRDVSVLDVGSGVRPFSLRRFPVHVCLEPFEPYLAELTNRFRHNSAIVPVKGSAPDDLRMFPDKSLDVVILADVLEHLSREAGQSTLSHALRIARHHVHVFTPDGFVPQHLGPLDDDEWGYVGNELQQHVSGWTAEDFQGWSVVRCLTYQVQDGKPIGALWATYTHSQQSGVLYASLHIVDPIDQSLDWLAWMHALEGILTFWEATIPPDLAPWSFRTSPVPYLPDSLSSVGLDAPDIDNSGSLHLGRGSRERGGSASSVSIVVLREVGKLDAVLAALHEPRILVLIDGELTGPSVERRAPNGGSYCVFSLKATGSSTTAIEWLSHV